MGTDPDHDRLTRSYPDTSNDPFSIHATSEAMGRLAEGTGGTRTMRTVMRVAAGLALLPAVVAIVSLLLGSWCSALSRNC